MARKSVSRATDEAAEAPTEAAETARWWSALTAEQRAEMLHGNADRLGSLDGIPADVRDRINRLRLVRERERLRSAEPRRLKRRGTNAEWSHWRKQCVSLDNTREMLRLDRSLSLLLLNIRDGHVDIALATGDVDHANHIGIFTQGMRSGAADEANVRWAAASMRDLRATAEDLLAQTGRGHESAAMIMWLGYSSPQHIDVARREKAEIGGRALASFAAGIRSTNRSGHLTGLGHSYGSVVTGIAAQQTDAFDAIAVFGSPGLGTSDVGTLRVPAGQVYALANPRDLVAASGMFGAKPTELAGVTVLSTAAQEGMSSPRIPTFFLRPRPSNLKAIGGALLDQHNHYLVENSTSLHNLAAIVVGAEEVMKR